MFIAPSFYQIHRLTAVLSLCLLGIFPQLTLAEPLIVFAAASLRESLEEVADGFEQEHKIPVVLSLAGSSVLARQIQHGAPADIFISANPDWMDALERSDLINPDSRFDLLGNTLVLIAPNAPDAAPPIGEITAQTDLSTLLGQRHLAMALTGAIPAGIYGKAALDHLGLWQGIMTRVVQMDNVRAALTLVSLKEAMMGIVYATDALSTDKVNVIGTFPPGSYPAIVYPVAALKNGKSNDSHAFLIYLQSHTAREVFKRHGFEVKGD